MSRVDKIETVRWFTTPEELRLAADRLQEKFNKARLGEDLTGAVAMSGNLCLHVVCDQERMKKT